MAPITGLERDAEWAKLFCNHAIAFGTGVPQAQVEWEAKLLFWDKYDKKEGVQWVSGPSPGLPTAGAFSIAFDHNLLPATLVPPTPPVPPSNNPNRLFPASSSSSVPLPSNLSQGAPPTTALTYNVDSGLSQHRDGQKRNKRSHNPTTPQGPAVDQRPYNSSYHSASHLSQATQSKVTSRDHLINAQSRAPSIFKQNVQPIHSRILPKMQRLADPFLNTPGGTAQGSEYPQYSGLLEHGTITQFFEAKRDKRDPRVNGKYYNGGKVDFSKIPVTFGPIPNEAWMSESCREAVAADEAGDFAMRDDILHGIVVDKKTDGLNVPTTHGNPLTTPAIATNLPNAPNPSYSTGLGVSNTRGHALGASLAASRSKKRKLDLQQEGPEVSKPVHAEVPSIIHTQQNPHTSVSQAVVGGNAQNGSRSRGPVMGIFYIQKNPAHGSTVSQTLPTGFEVTQSGRESSEIRRNRRVPSPEITNDDEPHDMSVPQNTRPSRSPIRHFPTHRKELAQKRMKGGLAGFIAAEKAIGEEYDLP